MHNDLKPTIDKHQGRTGTMLFASPASLLRLLSRGGISVPGGVHSFPVLFLANGTRQYASLY